MAADGDWVVADSSAILAYLANEPEAKTVADYRSRLAIPFIALTELTYLTWQRQGEEAAVGRYTLVTKWGRPILWPDEAVVLTAARFKAQYTLGIADSYIAAFARIHAAPLLTKDPDYQRLKQEITLIALS